VVVSALPAARSSQESRFHSSGGISPVRNRVCRSVCRPTPKDTVDVVNEATPTAVDVANGRCSVSEARPSHNHRRGENFYIFRRRIVAAR
jgi:hypothetical protein